MYRSPIADRLLAEHLLTDGAVTFMCERPMRLRSGLITPIYVNNRVLPSVPETWRDIVEMLLSVIDRLQLKADVIAGMEGAGVAHAAALAYRLGKPFVVIRRQAKTWGDTRHVDGMSLNGKNVLIIEDHLSTGLSLLAAIDVVREEGGVISDAVAITGFGIEETQRLLSEKGVTCHEAVDFAIVIATALDLGIITEEHVDKLKDWLKNPWTWAARHGLVANAVEG